MNENVSVKALILKEEIEKICSAMTFDGYAVGARGTKDIYEEWTDQYSQEIKKISELVGIYITFVGNKFYCYFLPLDLYDTCIIFQDVNITPPIKDIFIYKYNLFSSWLVKVIDVYELLDQYEGHSFTDELVSRMNSEFQRKVSNYNLNNTLSVSNMFMEFVGVY